MAKVILLGRETPSTDAWARSLRAAGHHVERAGASDLWKLRETTPDAVVIDLRRAPSQGRDAGVWLRRQKATRHTALVFVSDDSTVRSKVQWLLPDATYTDGSALAKDVETAIRAAPAHPTIPGTMDAYVGTPLPKKLGLRPDVAVALLDAPAGFDALLADRPPGVALRRDARRRCDVVVLFATSMRELSRRFAVAARATADGGRLWIAWPKRASGARSDLTQAVVRRFVMDRGFVDYKISSLDPTWSGLCFARRNTKEKRGEGG